MAEKPPKLEHDYEAIEAYNTLIRAEEIKNNKKLMERARKYAKLRKVSMDKALEIMEQMNRD